MMLPSEQNRMQRIAQVVESYAQQGLAVSVEETDNWAGYGPTQICLMKRRGNLPQPQFTYRIKLLATNEEIVQ